MLGFHVVFGHGIIQISSPIGKPMLSYSAPQPPFSDAYIKTTTTFKSVHNVGGIAINEAGDWIDFITKHIFDV